MSIQAVAVESGECVAGVFGETHETAISDLM